MKTDLLMTDYIVESWSKGRGKKKEQEIVYTK